MPIKSLKTVPGTYQMILNENSTLQVGNLNELRIWTSDTLLWFFTAENIIDRYDSVDGSYSIPTFLTEPSDFVKKSFKYFGRTENYSVAYMVSFIDSKAKFVYNGHYLPIAE